MHATNAVQDDQITSQVNEAMQPLPIAAHPLHGRTVRCQRQRRQDQEGSESEIHETLRPGLAPDEFAEEHAQVPGGKGNCPKPRPLA